MATALLPIVTGVNAPMAGAGRASVIGQQQSTVQWPAGTRLERASRAGRCARLIHSLMRTL
uniref:Uncharacterized protein n=1 Tax=Ralstonia solanacearum TaxID=305 RepID=A0A0S4XGJ9_RALSL|nr:protein of unknown function [Ralstonia solanacearum]